MYFCNAKNYIMSVYYYYFFLLLFCEDQSFIIQKINGNWKNIKWQVNFHVLFPITLFFHFSVFSKELKENIIHAFPYIWNIINVIFGQFNAPLRNENINLLKKEKKEHPSAEWLFVFFSHQFFFFSFCHYRTERKCSSCYSEQFCLHFSS